jgi:putative oxygen-independent coproporphyrinogen III oxidase
MSAITRTWEGAGLYVHLPFCARICPYCDFAVLTGGPARRQRFIEHLAQEFDCLGQGEQGAFVWPLIDTLYFGGGTPSLLEPPALEEILLAARRTLPLDPDAWLFLEANPEDVEPNRLAGWRNLGVRTLSLGIQAFDAPTLRYLGRHHDAEVAQRSVELAREAGFHTVSIDLIYGLPGDRTDRWRDNLEQALALAPDHLSCYQLTVHPRTVFGARASRGQLVELDEGAQAELFVLTHQILRDRGWLPYEVSNFARDPEHRSRHNEKYWSRLPYLGVGPSAHSFDGRQRWWNERQLGAYEARLDRGEQPIAGRETLSAADHALEAVMLGLRTTAGIATGPFHARHGIDLIARNANLLDALTRDGLLESCRDTLMLTVDGLAIADSIAAELDLTSEVER